MLTHVVRTSGRVRRTVLEVVRHDPGAGEWFVVSGFGPHSDWWRNTQAGPPLRVDVGRHRFVPALRTLDEDERRELLTDYQQRHPRAAKALGRMLLGADFTADPESVRHLANRLPAAALRV